MSTERTDQRISDSRRAELAESRRETGDRAGSTRHPPHASENVAGQPIQDDRPGNEAPVLPANAGGTDRVPTGEQDQPVDDESMYERRPERDQNRTPSGGG